MNFFAASASAEEEITSVTETSVPEVIDAAQEVIDAVAERNMDTSVLEHFGKSLLNYIPTVIIAVIIFLVGKLIAKLIIKIIDRAVGRSHIDKTAQNFLTSLLNTVFTAIVLVISLSALGIPMTSIITVIGAAGVAIGLALQSSLSNVAGGFIILFTKPFVKGDYIAVSGVEGSVHSISILSTQIVTVDNKVIYIPNGQVSTSTIINYSREAKRMV
ncbi:MAG: mechanosensitive ion channel, partial [Oscillospiraceae bacterium]|nr:mechanosensitive ion channel [Oscillospiraceae bacterium]